MGVIKEPVVNDRLAPDTVLGETRYGSDWSSKTMFQLNCCSWQEYEPLKRY